MKRSINEALELLLIIRALLFCLLRPIFLFSLCFHWLMDLLNGHWFFRTASRSG